MKRMQCFYSLLCSLKSSYLRPYIVAVISVDLSNTGPRPAKSLRASAECLNCIVALSHTGNC